ncbi:E3 ubiquitin-protein ligase TRIM39 [Salvelinus sp. IW2-2015]|uniref:E3 ubiquitin-protein ligase TRIM39 n=1 Tax=Salvelinus sp. IW2-2015 TaxID=2691554 RepID=UPI000CDF5C75|nr:E3 ubiquitin-protein ligase TRIM39 [Salvelinus alpinus]
MAYLAGNNGNLAEEQVHCSICLDVFTNPVSIPCGHNFCRCCILDYWKTTALFQCPMCKKTFFKRPDISINTVLREIAEQFKYIRVSNAERLQQQELKEERELQKKMEEKRKEQEEKKMEQETKKKEQQDLVQKQQKLLQELRLNQKMQKLQLQRTTSQEPEKLMDSKPEEKPKAPPALAPPSPPHTPWGEVSCDVCMGDRMKAVKSCLVCLTSYCEEHMKNHNTRFTKHKLIEPVANLEDRMCPKHERLLELFCKKDQMCVCVLCTETDHRAHYTVPVEREWSDKKAQLKKTEIDVQQMIQERLKKVEEIKHSVELNKSSAQREIEDSKQMFQELIHSIQRTQTELVLAIEEKQSETERWSQGLIGDLEQEITELQRRNKDLEHLSCTEDHIHFLQSFPALCSPPATKDWSGTRVHSEVCVGIIRRAVSELEKTLAKEIEKLVDTELKRIPKYSVDLTLDPDTANPWLQLSEDGRQVRHLGAWQDLPDVPERFDTVVIVLGCEGFSTGRHYWEVQVGDKDDWYLGVAKASVNRKGRIAISSSQGYWALAMKKGQEYRASTTPPLPLTLDPKPKRVGVYVDCEEGQVSFYNVRERSHIYTFMEDSFKEKLFPFFYLYCCDKQSDTMVICPANEKTQIKQC